VGAALFPPLWTVVPNKTLSVSLSLNMPKVINSLSKCFPRQVPRQTLGALGSTRSQTITLRLSVPPTLHPILPLTHPSRCCR
jgi:hypothetical protein